MNVPFITGNADLDAKFVKESKEAGLENLKGHRTVGGMRAKYLQCNAEGRRRSTRSLHEKSSRRKISNVSVSIA